MEKFLKTVSIAARSLMQHKLRSFLSILGIVCGVMAVLSMISIGEGARKEIVQQIEQLGTRNIYVKAVSLTAEQRRRARERLSTGLGLKDMKRIRAGCRNVRFVAALKEITATVTDAPGAISPQIVAVTATYDDTQNLVLSRGRFISELDERQRNMVCVIGNDIYAKMGVRGRLGRHLRIENQLFKVVGVLNRFHRRKTKAGAIAVRNYNEMMFIPLGAHSVLKGATLRKRRASDLELTEMVIQIRQMDQVLEAAKVIDRIVKISHNNVKDYQLIIPQELLRQAQEAQRTFNIVLGAIAGVSLLVGGIGIMNIMLATVSERIREIGIRRAVGASRSDIIFQFPW